MGDVTLLSIYYSNTPNSATTNTPETSHQSTVNILPFYVITVNSPNDNCTTTEHVRNNKINNNISIDLILMDSCIIVQFL